MDCRPPGSSVHGIPQLRILERVAISFSKGSFLPRWILYHWSHQGNLLSIYQYITAFIGEGNDTPLQYSCLENPMDGGAWWAAVHGSLESDTTEWLHFHFSLSCIGEGNGNPLQCSCLENPRDGGAWLAAISGVAQSRTRLKWLSSSSSKLTGTLKFLKISKSFYS